MYSFSSDRLKKKMVQRSMGKLALAKRLGISHTAVGKWRSGEAKPTLHHLERLTEILKCSPSSLFKKL